MISLPATNETVLTQVINPALDVLPARMRSDEARCLLLAIGRQESNFATRLQWPVAHAKGLWQFEQGGVSAVLGHPASDQYVRAICAAQDLPPIASAIWAELPCNDILACCMARLLLWTDPSALPLVGSETAAWEYYVANWRPGTPSRPRWDISYDNAMATMA